MNQHQRLVIPISMGDLPGKSNEELIAETRRTMKQLLMLTFGAITATRKYDLSENQVAHPRQRELLIAWQLEDMIEELIHRTGGQR